MRVCACSSMQRAEEMAMAAAAAANQQILEENSRTMQMDADANAAGQPFGPFGGRGRAAATRRPFFLSRTGGSRASRCDTNRVDEGVGCHHGAGDGPGWSGGRPASRRLEDACGCGRDDASAAHLAGVASVAGFQVAFQCSSGGLSQVGLVAGRAQSQYMLPRRPR